MESNRTGQFSWEQLIPVIAQVGVAAGFKLWQLAKDDAPVTAEQWADLHRLAHKTPSDYLAEAREKAAPMPFQQVP
jgi:hypothetical protein